MGAQEMNAIAALLNGFSQGQQMARENKMKESAALSDEQSKAVQNQYYQALADKATHSNQDEYIPPEIMTNYAASADMPHTFDSPVSLDQAKTLQGIYNPAMEYKNKVADLIRQQRLMKQMERKSDKSTQDQTKAFLSRDKELLHAVVNTRGNIAKLKVSVLSDPTQFEALDKAEEELKAYQEERDNNRRMAIQTGISVFGTPDMADNVPAAVTQTTIPGVGLNTPTQTAPQSRGLWDTINPFK